MRRSAVFIACVFAAGVLAPAAALAADAAEPAVKSKYLGGDAAELALFDLLEGRKLIEARSEAEKLLRSRPDSYAAHYVVGYALHHAEGNLPRAAHHLERARALYERRHPLGGDPEAPFGWHWRCLEELIALRGEMAEYEEELALLDQYEKWYRRPRTAERAWPLMRLRRFDAARRAAEEGIASNDAGQMSIARTARCAIAAESEDRGADHRACMEALEQARHEPGVPVVQFVNAADSKRSVFRPDEAERLLLEVESALFAEEEAWREATRDVSNPWMDLTDLYLGQGRLSEARDTVEGMLVWRAAQIPKFREQTWADVQATGALFLLAAGEAEEAAAITAGVVDRPDRTGYSSADTAQHEAGGLLLDGLVNRVAAERKAEEASWSAGWTRLESTVEAWSRRVRAWASRRRARALVASSDMLVRTFRPYVSGGLPAPEWMLADVVSAVGPGVASVALARARADETMPEATPYFDAAEAEILFRQGRRSAAEERAARALDTLPGSEVLLRAHVAALLGAAALDGGRPGRAAELFDQALQLDRGVVRARGLALPATIAGGGGEVAERAAALLRRSPRLEAAERGFTVEVRQQGPTTTACLYGPSRNLVGCGRARQVGVVSVEEVARRVAADFHAQVFAPRVDLAQVDLSSLRGSPVAAGETRYLAEGILDALTGGE